MNQTQERIPTGQNEEHNNPKHKKNRSIVFKVLVLVLVLLLMSGLSIGSALLICNQKLGDVEIKNGLSA